MLALDVLKAAVENDALTLPAVQLFIRLFKVFDVSPFFIDLLQVDNLRPIMQWRTLPFQASETQHLWFVRCHLAGITSQVISCQRCMSLDCQTSFAVYITRQACNILAIWGKLIHLNSAFCSWPTQLIMQVWEQEEAPSVTSGIICFSPTWRASASMFGQSNQSQRDNTCDSGLQLCTHALGCPPANLCTQEDTSWSFCPRGVSRQCCFTVTKR